MFRSIFSVALFAVAIILATTFGTDTTAFHLAAVSAVAHALMAVMPRIGLDLNVIGCDDDAVEQMRQLSKGLNDATVQLRKQQDDLKEAHREVMKANEEGVKLVKETRDNIDAAVAKANETSTQVVELGQKLDALRKAAEAPKTAVTLRGAIAKSLEDGKAKLDALKSRDAKSASFVVKDISSTEAAGLLRDPYTDTLVSLERAPLRIRDLLNVVPVNTDSVKYAKQTVRTNAARIVAEGTQKPYSQYEWSNATASIETIAHLAKMTLQAISDAPRLVAEVESEMRYGYAVAEEAEILNGDGSEGHLSGLIQNATAYSVPAGVTASNIITKVDVLRIAMLQIHLAYATPDAHVLSPVDVADMELLRRDPDFGGGYLFGNPNGETGVLRLWRLPTVESPSMTVGSFLTGAFKYAANLYQREGVSVLISTENDTDFETNQATMRVEGRLGLAVRRSYGLVKGSFAVIS